MTQKQIDEAIKNCDWRKEIHDVSICRGMAVPCSRCIENGTCDTLRKLFGKEEKTHEV